MPPRLKMIAYHDRVKTDLFRNNGKFQEFARAELFGGCLIAKPEHYSFTPV
jgi:hypothetical protein